MKIKQHWIYAQAHQSVCLSNTAAIKEFPSIDRNPQHPRTRNKKKVSLRWWIGKSTVYLTHWAAHSSCYSSQQLDIVTNSLYNMGAFTQHLHKPLWLTRPKAAMSSHPWRDQAQSTQDRCACCLHCTGPTEPKENTVCHMFSFIIGALGTKPGPLGGMFPKLFGFIACRAFTRGT